MEALTRVQNWKILQGEYFDKKAYKEMFCSTPDFSGRTKYYFACGHDAGRKKYKDWALTDLRDIPGVVKWDNLLGHPFCDGTLEIVKSKLALGMFTYNQAKFIFRETARVLADEGVFELTYRDFDRLLERREDISNVLFNRYINGNGLYFGSQRKSVWTMPAVKEIAKEYNFFFEDYSVTGMNVTVLFTREKGKLKSFSPEPKVRYDSDGNLVNDGGDFPGA